MVAFVLPPSDSQHGRVRAGHNKHYFSSLPVDTQTMSLLLRVKDKEKKIHDYIMDDNVKTKSIARIIRGENWILIQPDFLTNSLSLKR